MSTLPIAFNYKYYTTEHETETYDLYFDAPVVQHIAYHLDDVGHVVRQAEQLQTSGYYVALYLPYEAARYFNADMAVHDCPEGTVYAACYAFEQPVTPPDPTTLRQHDNGARANFTYTETDAAMASAIHDIQSAIVEGETYQVNYTTRLTGANSRPIRDVYYQRVAQGHGHYTALVDTPELQIASLSPELFFQKGTFEGEAACIVSKPMKGTMPRGATPEEDARHYDALRQSTKDRAENVMIVDLLRNDMTRVSEFGSIKVLSPFHIEQYDTVFQMTSMIKSTLKPNTRLEQMMAALFPCGSITGAPKLRTMSYIKALEQSPRQAYCGTIGLLMPTGRMIFNVAIRTIQYTDTHAVYGVGAGITINSIAANEIQEFKDKTRILEGI